MGLSRSQKHFKDVFDSSLTISLLVFILVAAFAYWLNSLTQPTLHEIGVEFNGMLMDILTFGILLTWINHKRRVADQTRGYLEQLDDFMHWKSEEGVWRKTGIIKRLLAAKVTLPSLRGIQMRDAVLREFDLSNTELAEADLRGSFLLDASLRNTDLSGANLEKAYLEKVDMSQADLSHTYAALCDCRGANFARATLVCANLEASLFIQANLENADLEGANLSRVNFQDAVLSNTNFHGSRCHGANFLGARVDGCDFRNADLREANCLTLEQMQTACIDHQTQLPDYLEKNRDSLLTLSPKNVTTPVNTRFPGGIPQYRTNPDDPART